MKHSSKLAIPYTNNTSLKLRYLAIKKFHEGHSRTAIAKILNLSRRWLTSGLKSTSQEALMHWH